MPAPSFDTSVVCSSDCQSCREIYGIACTRCNEYRYPTTENFRWMEARGRFHPWCRECERAVRRERAAGRRAILGAALAAGAQRLGRRLGITRRFGVEIEYYGLGYEEAERALADAGVPVRTRYDRPARGWRIKSDGSVHGGTGWEAVSPPLSGEAGLEQAKKVFETLKAAGARVDNTCGLHIHLDVSDVHADGIKLFVRSWFNNQPLIKWLVSQSRRNGGNGYCRMFQERHVERIERLSDLELFGNGRYWAVNVLSYPRHGTVEVRFHQGTLSFTKFAHWLRFCQALLDTCADSGQAVGAHVGLQDFLAEIGVEQESARWLHRRARRFGAPADVLGGAVSAPAEVAV